jgi:L-seryl-tRNA(Ser) seleniumtransferase
MKPGKNDLRSLPAVDVLIQDPQVVDLIQQFGRPLTVESVRSALADARLAHKDDRPLPSHEEILQNIHQNLKNWLAPTLIPVINATGVILHTNLGRAPLSHAALVAVHQVTGAYSTLEYQLERGVRGSRSVHAENLLTRLTGAEAALVVNNNAAAVMLALAALANRRRVIIARSQLVEIGGGFRIPDVMKLSGARLVEVGTTNRVHVSDYEAALAEPAALLLRVHHSNYQIIGFTSEPELSEIVAAGRAQGVPVMDDLGSGTLLDTARFGLAHEPTVQESIAAGADIVCFSGDKLLGGPQAGIIVGRAGLIARMKKHPFARAVRADKLALSALAATLTHYLKDEAERELPVWRMIAQNAQDIRARAEHWRMLLSAGEVIPSLSTVGGGSLPGQTLPTFVLSLATAQPNRTLAALRRQSPPVIARIEEDRVILDPRTVLPEQEGAFLAALRSIL